MLNEILYRLNAEYPGALKSMHSAIGFDYNRPMYAFRIEGKFTLSRIWKETNLDPAFHEIAVLVKQSARKWDADEIHYARLTGPKEYEMNPPRMKYFPGPKNRRSPIDTHFRKGDFEEDRKIADYAYIIAQLHENLTPPKENPSVELYRRYSSCPARSCFWGYSKNHSYYEIDKSGYPVEMKRDELNQAAYRIRNQRQKERADKTDFTNLMEGTRTNLEILRAELISALTVADSTGKMGAVQTAMTSLYWIFRDFKIAESKTNRKEWSSVAVALEAWTHIETKLNETHSKLKTALAPDESNETEQATA